MQPLLLPAENQQRHHRGEQETQISGRDLSLQRQGTMYTKKNVKKNYKNVIAAIPIIVFFPFLV